MRITEYNVRLNEDKIPILLKESATNYSNAKELNDDEKIANMMKDVFDAGKMPEEHFWILALDMKFHPIGVFEVSRGSLHECILHPREIFLRLCLCNAKHFIAIHNHPSGNTSPSKDDILLTKRLKECGKLMGIALIDHIIIGDDHFSFAHNNMLED